MLGCDGGEEVKREGGRTKLGTIRFGGEEGISGNRYDDDDGGGKNKEADRLFNVW